VVRFSFDPSAAVAWGCQSHSSFTIPPAFLFIHLFLPLFFLIFNYSATFCLPPPRILFVIILMTYFSSYYSFHSSIPPIFLINLVTIRTFILILFSFTCFYPHNISGILRLLILPRLLLSLSNLSHLLIPFHVFLILLHCFTYSPPSLFTSSSSFCLSLSCFLFTGSCIFPLAWKNCRLMTAHKSPFCFMGLESKLAADLNPATSREQRISFRLSPSLQCVHR